MSENKRGRTFRSRGYPNRRGHRFPRSHCGGLRQQYGHSGTTFDQDCGIREEVGHVKSSSQNSVQEHSHGYSVNVNTSRPTQKVEQVVSLSHELPGERHSQGSIVNDIVSDAQNQLPDERLLSAVDSGTVEDMLKVLRSKETCSQKGLDTAILAACRRGHKFMIQTLVQVGASLSSINEDGYTALMFASERGYVEIVKFLINKGADVNAQNFDGDSPLMLSILPSGSVEMIQFLVDRKANVNLQNKKGNSALIKAIEIQDLDAIRVLIDADANLNLINAAGKTALEIAKEKQFSIFVTIFRDSKGPKKNTPLTKAVALCNINAVKMLLDCHISEVNTINGYGKTPLRTLLESMNSHKKWFDKIEILKLLLQNGADVNLKRGKQNSSLNIVTTLGSYEVVQLLCKYKARPNTLSPNGLSALMIAAKDGRKDLLLLLLNHGASVHMTGRNGDNALIIALKYGNIDCAKILFDISPKLSSTVGVVALELIDCEQVKSMEFLFKNLTVDVNLDLIRAAVRRGKIDMIRFIINMGADVNKPDFENLTPLYHSTYTSIEVVKLLVEHGADVNMKHPVKGSLLIEAAVEGRPELVRFFLNKGVCVDDVDASQRTALIRAIDSDFCSQCKTIVEMLLEMKADVNRQGENGKTALSVAVEKNRKDVIDTLLDAGADLEIKTVCGETPFLAAARTGKLEILRVLKQRGANVIASDTDGCTALMKTVIHSKRDDYGETIKFLAYDQPYLNRQNDKGFTSLMLTAQRGHIQNVLTLLELGADVNVMANDTTAMALLLNHCFVKAHLQCFCELVKRGALSSLPSRCRSVLHKMILLDQRSLIEFLVTCGMGPVVLDLRSVMLGTHISGVLNSLVALNSMSPLHVSLSCGNIKVARYLVDIWFLTASDIYHLPKNKVLHDMLTVMGRTKCLNLLEQLNTQPLSLLQLSFMAVSTCLGSNPGREERVRKTPLPHVLQERLLFHNEYIRIDMSMDDEEHGIRNQSSDSEEGDYSEPEHFAIDASFFSWDNSISDSSNSFDF